MLIDIFSVGEKQSNGIVVNTTIDDLNNIAETYNNNKQKAPLVIGHVNESTAPALGWVKSLKVKDNILFADVETNELFDKKVLKEKQYKNISIRLSKENKLKHIALLGASIPADPNISSIDFSENNNDEDIILDFAAPTIIDIVGIIGYDVTSQSIKKQIKDKDNLLIRLYSPGGYVSEGMAIYNLLLSKEPKIMIYGDTSSAATIIAQAAGKGKLGIANNVNFLIHQPRVGLMGYYLNNELNDISHNLLTDKNNILSVYANRVQEVDKMEKIKLDIDNEKVYSSAEAKKLGLVDFIFDPAKEDLDFSLNNINNILFNSIHRIETENITETIEAKEVEIINNKELEMDNVNNNVDYSPQIIDLQGKLDNVLNELNLKNAQIVALENQTKLLKEKETINTVKTDIKKLSNSIHIDSENVEKLNNALISLINVDSKVYNDIVDIINDIKPKAPQGEFKPENLDSMINEPNPTSEVDLVENYAKANNMTFNQVIDMIADNKLTIENLKGVK